LIPVDEVNDILGSVADENVADADGGVDLDASDCGDLLSGIRNDPPDKIPARLSFFPHLLCFFEGNPMSLSSLEAMVTLCGVTSSRLTSRHNKEHFN